MKIILRSVSAGVAATFFCICATQAATIYDESVHGDLTSATEPTLVLALGSNTMIGSAYLYGPSSGFGDDFDSDPYHDRFFLDLQHHVRGGSGAGAPGARTDGRRAHDDGIP